MLYKEGFTGIAEEDQLRYKALRVEQMTDSAGEVVFDQDYLPFGGDLAVVGDLEPVNDVGERYKYTGQRQEVSIGLYYYGARFYDPELGRFITEDIYAGEIVNPQGQNIYVYVMNNPMKYVDPTGHAVEEEKGDFFKEVGDWFSGLLGGSSEESFNGNIPEERMPLFFELPYPDVPTGDQNDFYFPSSFKDNLTNSIAPTVGQNLNIADEAGLLFSMAMQFATNLQPDKNAVPPLERQKKINQILYTWNKRLANPNIKILDADFDIYRYSGREAVLRNVLNSSSDAIVGGILGGADTILKHTTPIQIPIIKSAFQPRLPRYKAGDIALTVGYTYTYREGTPRSGITHKGYFKHWTDKAIKREFPEGGSNWLYVNQLELQIRSSYIIEAEYLRNTYRYS